MLTIRVSGTGLNTARTLLGWSLQELAGRSGVNWLTIRKYESAGDFHDYLLEERYAAGQLDSFPAYAHELVELPVDMIVAGGGALASELAGKRVERGSLMESRRCGGGRTS
jgi:transcriptional regulator with XRE-family HTH domain